IAVAAAQALQGARNLVTFAWGDLFAIKRQDNLDPLQGPCFVARRFQELQRAESKVLVIAGDRVMGAAGRRGQGIQTHSLVEDKNRDVAIAAELGDHQRQESAFAGAGRTKDYRVAQVTDMEIQAERGVWPLVTHCIRAGERAGYI